MSPTFAFEDSEHRPSSSVFVSEDEVGLTVVDVVTSEAIAIHADREMSKGLFEAEQCICNISYLHISFVHNSRLVTLG